MERKKKRRIWLPMKCSDGTGLLLLKASPQEQNILYRCPEASGLIHHS